MSFSERALTWRVRMTRFVPLRIFVLAIPAALLGCSRAADRTASVDSSHSSPATATTVTERGIGPLRVGMTLAEASAALGGALAAPASADTAGCHYVRWRGG